MGIKRRHNVTVEASSRMNDIQATRAFTRSLIKKDSGIPTMTHNTIVHTLIDTKRESLSEWTLALRVTHAMKQQTSNRSTLYPSRMYNHVVKYLEVQY